MVVGTLLQGGIFVTASNLTVSWLLLCCSLVCKRSSNGRDTAPSRHATRSGLWRVSPTFIYCLVGGCSSSGVTLHACHTWGTVCITVLARKFERKCEESGSNFFFLNSLYVSCLHCTDIVLCRWLECLELNATYFALKESVRFGS
jgi:hypothetical protein